ncbi:MAG: glycosyltransferase [Fimbriimonas sp.]
MAGEVFVFVSQSPWHGPSGDWRRCAEVAAKEGAHVILGDWSDESHHRQYAVEHLRAAGKSFVLIPDGDEIVEERLLAMLAKIAWIDGADLVRVHMDTYWRSPEYVVRPREGLTPALMINVQKCDHLHIREYSGERLLTLGPEYGVLHHLSYAGPDERIARKISTWGHRDEVDPQWFEKVWLNWPSDRLQRNLHPTHPAAYGQVERIPVPGPLRQVADLSGLDNANRPGTSTPARLPTTSIVIPVHGNPDDLEDCLRSLSRCRDLFHEVIVVDDISPEPIDAVLAAYPWVRAVRNEENLGFAGTCNHGYDVSTGEIVLFLNSDTIVPWWGLLRLIECVAFSDASAAGSLTNNAGYHQQIDPTFSSFETLDLFAEDFAHRPAADLEVDMVVGFCLAVRREALEAVGGFDDRFRPGMFEDNDLCYRLRRSGRKLRIASKSYVHHKGSRTISKLREHPTRLLDRNKKIYEAKWALDIQTGFASHLSGHHPEPIRFDFSRHPDALIDQIREMSKAADISLCMIVRNEERVLRDCLQSARPFFQQIIVVDTGSDDATLEIARSEGAEVYEFPWTESFSEARNESLRYARGKWCFWMDADDTLPFGSGVEILRSALEAPSEIVAFVVPVQFTDQGTAAGTRVDHVKLFRNLPGIQFEGRIHEQNLGSLREIGGDVARCDAVVLHSGYDTSPDGQERKRQRDYRLLELDHQERPGHPFVLFNLGMTDHFTGRHPEAISWLRKSIEVSRAEESHIRKAYALLAGSHRLMDRSDLALAALEEGLQAVGSDPELHFLAGCVLTDLARFEEARDHYLAMPCDVSGHFSSIDTGILTFKRNHNLGLVFQALGDYDAARAQFLEALGHRPLFEPAAAELFRIAMERSDMATAQEVLETLYRASGPSEAWATMGAEFSTKTGGPAEAASFLQRAIDAHPIEVGPRLVLARQLLAQGAERAALPHLHRLIEQGCGEAAFYLGVHATRVGEFAQATDWMEMAHELDPGNPETVRCLENLRNAMAQEG